MCYFVLESPRFLQEQVQNVQMSNGFLQKPGSPDKYFKENVREQKRSIMKLCSLRLLPTRHQTKNAVLSILNDGEVNKSYKKNTHFSLLAYKF